jgi:hypothetical protein
MLTKKLTDRLNENGTPHVEYTFDGSDGMEGVLVTGPVKGEVVLADGTRYDVTPEVIEHKPGHAGLISHHIERKLEQAGELRGIRDPEGVLEGDEVGKHVCTEACGTEAD